MGAAGYRMDIMLKACTDRDVLSPYIQSACYKPMSKIAAFFDSIELALNK
jgi:hypothetical protein